MLAFASRIPLALWLAAALAGAVWWGLRERDGKIAAQEALRGADATIEAINNYAYELTGIEAGLRTQLEALANVPDTNGCGPRVHRALDGLR